MQWNHYIDDKHQKPVVLDLHCFQYDQGVLFDADIVNVKKKFNRMINRSQHAGKNVKVCSYFNGCCCSTC